MGFPNSIVIAIPLELGGVAGGPTLLTGSGSRMAAPGGSRLSWPD